MAETDLDELLSKANLLVGQGDFSGAADVYLAIDRRQAESPCPNSKVSGVRLAVIQALMLAERSGDALEIGAGWLSERIDAELAIAVARAATRSGRLSEAAKYYASAYDQGKADERSIAVRDAFDTLCRINGRPEDIRDFLDQLSSPLIADALVAEATRRSRGRSLATVPSEEAFVSVFIGGCGRSGTTLAHSLICTSGSVNRHTMEFSSIKPMVSVYNQAMAQFKEHNWDFFDSPDEIKSYFGGVISHYLYDVWVRLKRPSLLALKDPLLTLFFPHLAQFLPRALFVVMVRDPRDVVLSAMETWLKGNNMDRNRLREVPWDYIRQWCSRYVEAYKPLLQNPGAFEGKRLLVIRYQDLASGSAVAALQSFLGISDINVANPWDDSRLRKGRRDTIESQWYTELMGKPLSTVSVGRWRTKLPQDIRVFVEARCGHIARAYGVF